MISHVPYGAYTEIENVQWWDEHKHEKIFSFIRPLEISVSMARDPRSSRCTVESSVPSFKSEGEIPTISSESFRVYGSVAFGAFMLCHYHFYRVSKCFHHSKRKPHTHQAVALPLPLETTHRLSVSRLTYLGASHTNGIIDRISIVPGFFHSAWHLGFFHVKARIGSLLLFMAE